MLDTTKCLNKVEDCNFVSVMDFDVIERLYSCCSNEEIKAITFEELEDEDPEVANIAWVEKKQHIRANRHSESLDLLNREVKSFVPSIKSLFVLQLKLLPSYLKYVYLNDNNTLPIIISSSLNVGQEKSLVDVLGEI